MLSVKFLRVVSSLSVPLSGGIFREKKVPPCSKRKNSAREQTPEAAARESNSPKAPPNWHCEKFYSAPRTISMSLSPLPERQTTIILSFGNRFASFDA